MGEVIYIKPADGRTERIKELDGWIEDDCGKLINLLNNNPETFRPLISKLDSITCFAAKRADLLRGGAGI